MVDFNFLIGTDGSLTFTAFNIFSLSFCGCVTASGRFAWCCWTVNGWLTVVNGVLLGCSGYRYGVFVVL